MSVRYDTLVAGATGLVGREIVRQLALLPNSGSTHLLVRRPIEPPAGTTVHVVDFAALPALPRARRALCALGTTIAQAGSQAAFRAVDFDAVLAFARAAHAAGVSHFAVVSALGAHAGSRNFYNRVKGEMEAALAKVPFDVLVIARPSLLDGDREELAQPARVGEDLALRITRPLSALIPRALRPIKPQTVARGMLHALTHEPPGVYILGSAELQAKGGHPL
jgi:uncharacterized protein YbjT (DUF2867 family)